MPLDDVLDVLLPAQYQDKLVREHKRIISGKRPYVDELVRVAYRFLPKEFRKGYSPGSFEQVWINHFLDAYLVLRDNAHERVYTTALEYFVSSYKEDVSPAQLSESLDKVVADEEMHRAHLALFWSLKTVFVERMENVYGKEEVTEE